MVVVLPANGTNTDAEGRRGLVSFKSDKSLTLEKFRRSRPRRRSMGFPGPSVRRLESTIGRRKPPSTPSSTEPVGPG